MALSSFINTVATEPALARWTSLINNQPQPFPIVFFGDTKAYRWYFHNNGTLEPFSGNALYSLKVTLGNVDSGPSGGSYTLTCGTTTIAIPWNACSQDIAAALNDLPTVIAFGGVNVSGVFPNFLVYSNDLGVVTAITADASLLSPNSSIQANILTTGSVSARQQTQLVLRRGVIASETGWTPISGQAGWEGTMTTNTEGGVALLTEFGEIVGGYLQAETQLTAEVTEIATGLVTAFYQITVLFRGKNSDFTSVVPTPFPPTSGTVTSVSVVTANGLSGVVANPTTTPAITLTLSLVDGGSY